MEKSALQLARYSYAPKLPEIYSENLNKLDNIVPVKGKPTSSETDCDKISSLFPNTYGLEEISFSAGKSTLPDGPFTVGVILSGGQAPGGHNVICGLYDALKKADSNNVLLGFCGGPSGILEDKYINLTDSIIDDYRNTGGFDMIQSGRTKLETEEQFKVCLEVCKKHSVNALVIIGGDDSNTNAAVLAEFFKKQNADITVIGCPKTIDGDLKNKQIETSFGFDTATKTYSELIGNICKDANSSRKYWHFIRLMGRSASHIALECALQTHPNICLIGEEIEAKNLSIQDITNYIADVIVKRSSNGNNFGICLIPEGLVEFIPSLKKLISEINNLLAENEREFSALPSVASKIAYVESLLSEDSKKVFNSLPQSIESQLLLDRDPHGNVQVSLIETEKLFIETVRKRLNYLHTKGQYNGKFSAQNHFFGYEGRCAFPSNFDADYCYSLGFNAFFLIKNKLSGYLSSISNLSESAEKWVAGGIPITMMMNMETRHGEQKPVIKKALVDLKGNVFKFFESKRKEWETETSYVFPGAIQYFGPAEVCNATTLTLSLEHS